eukprot:4398253-Pleurochrysis_carterae.AAC.4
MSKHAQRAAPRLKCSNSHAAVMPVKELEVDCQHANTTTGTTGSLAKRSAAMRQRSAMSSTAQVHQGQKLAAAVRSAKRSHHGAGPPLVVPFVGEIQFAHARTRARTPLCAGARTPLCAGARAALCARTPRASPRASLDDSGDPLGDVCGRVALGEGDVDVLGGLQLEQVLGVGAAHQADDAAEASRGERLGNL